MKGMTQRLVVVAAAVAVIGSGSLLRAQEKSWEELDQASKRAKIDETAEKTKDDVRDGNAKAEELYKDAYGWAAFDNLKIAFGFSGGGGNDIAVCQISDMGLMAATDIAGTKYWKNDKLNE